MLLAAEVKEINKSLKEFFGVDTISGSPIFRVEWSDSQFEKKLGTYDDYSGLIYLRTVTEVREVRKYIHIHERYVLERLVVIPEYMREELPTIKISYEPLWVFEDSSGNYLPPRLDACQFIINTVLTAQAVHKMMIDGTEQVDRPLTRYIDPEGTQDGYLLEKKKRIETITEELFGDESGLLGTTITGESVVVPHTYRGES